MVKPTRHCTRTDPGPSPIKHHAEHPSPLQGQRLGLCRGGLLDRMPARRHHGWPGQRPRVMRVSPHLCWAVPEGTGVLPLGMALSTISEFSATWPVATGPWLANVVWRGSAAGIGAPVTAMQASAVRACLPSAGPLCGVGSCVFAHTRAYRLARSLRQRDENADTPRLLILEFVLLPCGGRHALATSAC